MRLAYVVATFPTGSETFIVREMNAVADRSGTHVELFSLMQPTDGFTHPAAARWMDRVHRPSGLENLRGLGWWALRRPLRLASSLAMVIRSHARRRGVLKRALATWLAAPGLARTMRQLGVGHMHAHFANHPALAAWLCSRLTRIPYSFTAHAHDLYMDRSLLARKVADASFVVAISELNARLVREVAVDGASVHVIHCGIDPATLHFRVRELPAAGPLTLACVASLRDYKGHDVLLEALRRGGERLERVHVELIGDGERRGELEALALSLGLGGRVRFRGALSEAEVAAALDRADLFALASVVGPHGRMDGIPVALMEALASGLPVVASRLSGIPELVRDGETGLLAEPGDPDSLAAALARVLADPEAAARRARAGRRLVEEQFNLASSTRQLAALLERAA